jgi:glycosyltransferase involved in cell wall biosynthesis
MNIVFHHRTRGRGAEGAHIRGVLKGLRELGHDVTLMSIPGADPEEEDRDIAAGRPGPLRYLTNLTQYVPEFLFELFELGYNIMVLARVGSAVRHRKTDMIYERYALFMFAGVWLANRRGVPCILEINDSCLVPRVRPLFFNSIARRIERWTFQNATGLVFISSQFRRIVAGEFGQLPPSVVSPNAADLDLFRIDEEAAARLRKELGITDQFVLGYVGAFVRWHGIDWFVERIAKRLKEFPSLTLLLIGDGVCFESIRELVEREGVAKQVLMPGRVPHHMVATYIGAMDFGILPDSNEYGSPMKLFEFMAMAKASVVPDFGPIAEVISDNETGWLFAANDQEACIDRVLSLVAKPEECRRVGHNARQYIETSRQWRHNAEQLLTLVPDDAV